MIKRNVSEHLQKQYSFKILDLFPFLKGLPIDGWTYELQQEVHPFLLLPAFGY